MVARPRAGGQRRYACVTDNGGCGRITVNADPLEQLVTEATLYRLDTPELAAALNGQASEAPDAARFRSEVAEAQAQLAELGEAYANKQIGMPELIAARNVIEARLDAARKQLAKLTRTNALDRARRPSRTLRECWDALDLSRQHAIIEAIIDRLTIAPARPATTASTKTASPRPGASNHPPSRRRLSGWPRPRRSPPAPAGPPSRAQPGRRADDGYLQPRLLKCKPACLQDFCT